MSQIPIGWWIDRGGSLAFNRYIDDDGIPNRPLYFYQKDMLLGCKSCCGLWVQTCSKWATEVRSRWFCRWVCCSFFSRKLWYLLVGALEHLLFFHILGISSSQLTFIFFRGVAQPPTSCDIWRFDVSSGVHRCPGLVHGCSWIIATALQSDKHGTPGTARVPIHLLGLTTWYFEWITMQPVAIKGGHVCDR